MTTTYQVITADDALNMIARDRDILLIDVRMPDEYSELHITGALNLPLFDLLKNIESYAPDLNHTIIAYCETGRRSRCAAQALIYFGYTRVYDAGGIT